MKLLVKIIATIALIGMIGYVGACAYGNWIAKEPPTNDQPQLPDVNDAAYSLYVVNTGTVLFTDDFEQYGELVGERTYVLHGYFEQSGTGFVYKDTDMILQEQLFGEINLKRR